MFAELLHQALVNTPGAVSVTLSGYDGIAIDAQKREEAETLGAADVVVELGMIAQQLKRVTEDLRSGEMQEFTVQTTSLTTVIRPVTADYFLALSLEPTGFVGKARYQLRVLAPRVAQELAS